MSLRRIFTKLLLWGTGLTLSAGALLLLFLVYYMSTQLPDITQLETIQLQVPLKIYSKDGKLISQYGEKRRIPEKIENIPPMLINAILSTEDQRYFEHPGVDIWGLLRAAKIVILQGSRTQGGSTITMQVARNFFLTPKKTYTRKFNEILLAIKIDHQLSKKKILELYLNKIYLGHRAYGVAAAASVYYGKPLTELTLPQMAMIAGLPKAPSALNPLSNPRAAIKRRNHVLKRLYELGHLNHTHYLRAKETPVTAGYHELPIALEAPYVAELAREVLIKHFGKKAYTQGLKVYTSIDSRLQTAANNTLQTTLLDYDRRHEYRGPEKTLANILPDTLEIWRAQLDDMRTVHGLIPAVIIETSPNDAQVLTADNAHHTLSKQDLNWVKTNQSQPCLEVGDVVRLRKNKKTWGLAQLPAVDGALVALTPNNGSIQAMVGGFNYQKSNFNRVVQAKRQAGSLMKPFLYAAALAKGNTFATLINDAPVVIYDQTENRYWRPKNHDRRFYGPTRLREGLIKSRNLVSIRLLQAIGVDNAVDYLKQFGFSPAMLPKTLSLALGTGVITPLDMASGFAIFANGGYKISPFLIERVVDWQDNVLFEVNPKTACELCTEISSGKTPARAPRAISPQIAYLIDDALHDVIQRGTGRRARVLGRSDLTGKTGTTNDQIDNWFSGYNHDLVVTTWLGFDKPRSLGEYGSQTALPMWIAFMKQALKGKPASTHTEPPGLIRVLIDKTTGEPATPGSDNSMFEIFLSENAPTAAQKPIPPSFPNNTELMIEKTPAKQHNTQNKRKKEFKKATIPDSMIQNLF